MNLSDDQLRTLAAHGAKVRIEEIRAELATLEDAFPELANHQPLSARTGKPIRHPEISARMKAVWAARRAAKARRGRRAR